MHKNNFDFLRFTLAFIVVLHHIIDLTHYYGFQFLNPFFNAYFSVTGFFIISGFLITGSFIKTQNMKRYFIKRARRLLPAYIFTVVLCAILLSVTSSLNYVIYFTNTSLYKYIISNLLFLNFTQPCLPGVFINNSICAINGALWTIKVEVSFYLFLPLIIMLANRFNKKYILFISIYIFSVFYKLTLQYLSTISPGHTSVFDLLSHQLPGFLTFFISGIGLYYYFDEFIKWKNKLIVFAIPIFIIEYYLASEIFLPLAFSIIILYIAFSFKFLNNWGKYGDFSYGIYIYHFPIIQLAISLGFFYLYNPWIVALAIILIVIFISILSWNLLEKKFLKRA
jgi:peptidoglycan/LPS O-acetylase OafA/YrhL